MKKIIAILMACLFVLSFTTAFAESEKTLSIVCTTFPQYDWVRQILGDRVNDVDLTLLLDNGIDLHNYQPTAGDIIRIARCDLFIYTGGESDGWVDDVLATAQNPRMKIVNLLASVEAKEEETVEGMQEEDHDHDEHDEHAHDEIEYDEHVWLSLRNAETLIETIANTLCELDAANAPAYQENAANYIAQLSELDNQYKDVVANGQRTTILFADRFPFRYLADDYGLTYYAAFAGCSAETRPALKRLRFLPKRLMNCSCPPC